MIWLICHACGWTVRVSRELVGERRPRCIACLGEMEERK